MSNVSLTIVGLGPGIAGYLSLETMHALENAEKVILRTSMHPTVTELEKQQMKFVSCDHFYEEGRNFEEVYAQIVDYVLTEAKNSKVVYAVPGSPLVAERTVVLLREVCAKEGLALEILPAMSFLDLAYVKLNLDPITGLRIADAADEKLLSDAGRYPLIITQVYSKMVAAELKLNLMEVMDDEDEVFFMRNLGLPDEVCKAVPLYELDRQENIDHLTTVYVPAFKTGKMDMTPLIEVVKTLREPGGCVWDREQTHESIRKGLIEETYELLEAIDNKDLKGMREELGDVLLQVVFHARLAEEEGGFVMQDVINDIVEKLINRHPHVFGTIEVGSSEEVIHNWEKIKAEEKKERTLVLDGISPGLPTLMRSYKLQSKAAKVGFDWPDDDGVLKKIQEELQELAEAVAENNPDNIEWELGDVLLVMANYARHLGVEPETALNRANNRFVSRFNFIEQAVLTSGRNWADFSLVELEELWQEAKKNEKN